jgi:hypothetical protein
MHHAKTCIVCHSEFYPLRGHARYCTDACRQADYRVRQRQQLSSRRHRQGVHHKRERLPLTDDLVISVREIVDIILYRALHDEPHTPNDQHRALTDIEIAAQRARKVIEQRHAALRPSVFN